MAMHEIEVWVLVDASGDYGVGRVEEDAYTSYNDDIDGELAGSRMVKLTLKIELPDPLTIEATLPAREGKVSMTVAG